MKEYDFIIVYETKNRELESMCLLKTELENRGFSVKMVETWWCLHHVYEPVNAKVMITFALYDNAQLKYTLSFARGIKQIINMQWEQIYSNADEENPNSSYIIKENPKNYIHISWGQYNYKWLVKKCGISKNNVIRSGHIGADFVKPAFASYFKSRSDLLNEFHIDESKHLLLFISSFSYVGLPSKIISQDIYQNTGSSPESFQIISIQSQKEIINWVKRIMPKHKDWVFVYRPHPAEVGNNDLLALEKELSNFRVINKYSVKQWIKCSDKIYSWFSTSVADAFFCNKSVDLLRPFSIPYEMDVTIYNGASFITTAKEFEDSLALQTKSSISNDVFYEYFDYDETVYSFKLIADKCTDELTKVIASQEIYRQNSPSKKRKFYQIGVHSFLRRVNYYFVNYLPKCTDMFRKRAIIALYCKKPLRSICTKKWPDYDYEYNMFIQKMIRNNYSSVFEIQRIQKRIRKLIELL